jgi:dTDP-4-dehydrorhamnose reductase
MELAANRTIIIRTSWLYSEFGHNFLKTMLRLGKERNELGIVADQIGSPTYARDLAKAILDVIIFSEKDKFIPGIYHYANKGAISWYDFTKKIFEIENIDCKLNAITTADYPTPAKRPAYSVFDTSKIKETYNVDIPKWDTSLKECLKSL